MQVELAVPGFVFKPERISRDRTAPGRLTSFRGCSQK